ncbi:hypothetical protein Dxin01_04240 [Deinococcus xinjiangensis]|uniref:Transposase n=1 Tax=Deinococcus xinjiangensis TaxID=457454 RepID=A0ABP9VGW9_9DEIO
MVETVSSHTVSIFYRLARSICNFNQALNGVKELPLGLIILSKNLK